MDSISNFASDNFTKVMVKDKDGVKDVHISFFSNMVQKYRGAEVLFWRVIEVDFTQNGMKVLAKTDTEMIPGGDLSWEQIDAIRNMVTKRKE